ncbi:serine carboxypeptidase [Lentinus tigrinus ALCF2SS1-7]|uniref:serine carboxypeptidase n=1 Tax=Lentinus tigrinus ALCF2SS1-7 TaxID=1328758 RepID=UPI001165D4FA|nr:serine carboxypeptidase [Lentinus tigrinus ALCF2SS1-7]
MLPASATWHALLGLLLAVPQVLAGQVPVYDGMIGTVPNASTRATSKPSVLAASGNGTTAQTTPGKLRVIENSGVCETTPGVYQASGYGDLSANESLWFWFFAARENSDSAPLTIWLNGGPGSSSMIGLFQENGPCRITNDSSAVTSNQFSWNNVSNVLYLDQPVGTGFSHGDLKVGTSPEAASDVWKFLQIFFADSRFSKYKTNDFALWTESYGGHYGPTIAAYILDQNARIANGTVNGTAINLHVLGIGNGLTDPLSQYPGYISYAASNPYHPLVSSLTLQEATDAWNKSGGCEDLIKKCYSVNTDQVCSDAQDNCNTNILNEVLGPYDPYYVLNTYPDAYPPDLTPYLTDSALMQRIGAESTWVMSNDDIYFNFAVTGDWMRSSRPLLESVINAGVRTIIYDGDVDYICNYVGVEAMVDALQTKFTDEYSKQQFANFTVDGQVAGIYKNAGTFSYVRIYGAGHEVPAYTHGTLGVGQAAFQMFSQIMSNSSLSSTGLGQSTSTSTTGSAAGQPTSQPNSSPMDLFTSIWTVLGSALLTLTVLPF